MRFVKKIKETLPTKEAVNKIIHLKPVVLFLINETPSHDTDFFEKKEFSFIFRMEASPGFSTQEPIIVGQYNGIFGFMDGTLKGDNFIHMHSMEDALSNQLALYLIQELMHYPSEDKVHLESMIISLADYLTKRFCEQSEASKNGQMSISPYHIKSITSFIYNNINNHITASDLAKIAGLSVHHFIRTFKRSTGETPYQYVINLKMKRAKNLLLNSNDSIIQIGIRIGYDNASHFSRLFKNTFGISPLKFRRAYQQTNFDHQDQKRNAR